MFGGSKKEDDKKMVEGTLSIIAPGTTFVGDIISEGDISVKGRVVGNLICKSKVVVGPKGRIEGNVDTLNAAVSGEIIGTLTVRGLLELKETAKVQGDIVAENKTMDKGSVHNGSNYMSVNAKDMLAKAKDHSAAVESRVKQQTGVPFTENEKPKQLADGAKNDKK